MTGSKYPFQDLLDFLMRLGRSRHAAEDLVQESFTRLLEYRRNGGEVKNEEAFVKRTAVNLSIDEYRHRKRYPVAEGDIGDLERTLPLVHEGPGPDEVLYVDQRLIEIRDRLYAFSKRSGDIYMAHRAGFSYKEIAAHYRISCSAVDKHIARVVEWLMDRKDPI
jgi:RNA polymerase sigma-70 factor (ECF subfamily)